MRRSSTVPPGKQDRRRARITVATVASIVVLACASLTAPVARAQPRQPGIDPQSGQAPSSAPAPPGIDAGVHLADSTLRHAVARLADGQPAGPGVLSADGRILVEVLHHLSDQAITQRIEDAGGTVNGSVPGALVQGYVPAGRLEALEATPGVDYVRPPRPVSVPLAAEAGAVSGQEVAKTRANAWHAAGRSGQGVKVGIVDLFGSAPWNSAVASGDLVSPAGTFCRDNGASCDLWANGVSHGVGVAEIIHEMAPSASLYLATVGTTADLQAAVDYFAAQGVTVISRSLTSAYDGPGNGTGPIATVINNAVASGMAWFQAAGNNGGATGVDDGSYWRGGWNDPDGDGWLNFAPSDELMRVQCTFFNGLRWNDFGAGTHATDYDVYVYDSDGWLIGQSTNSQAAGAPPLELAGTTCSGGQYVYLLVVLTAAGDGTAGDVLEFMTNSGALEYWQNRYSASGPAADTASAGAVTVGAIDPPNGTTIGSYSARGPTNDNRTKPDLVTASCVVNHSVTPCFAGTSAATPAAAGAAALVRGAGFATTPASIRSWLLAHAMVDRGNAGTDNNYGHGELILPLPPQPRPDGRIKKGVGGSYVGNDVYNGTGDHQTKRGSAARGSSVTYYVSVQNDATLADVIRLKGTSSNTQYAVTYWSGPTEVTSAVIAGAYVTPSLAPGATHVLKVVVTVRSGAAAGSSLAATLTAKSTTDTSRRDTVKFVTSRA